MASRQRDIILIDEDLCDGCGDCISACAEGALELVNGKAKLKEDFLCDGAGACIGYCPTGALTVIKREAVAYDEVAVEKNLQAIKMASAPEPIPMVHAGGGCPGSAMRSFNVDETSSAGSPADLGQRHTQLRQWPVQLMLVPPNAPYFQDADLLIAADCVPFAHPEFHETYLKGKALLVGCPKLDNLEFYVEKLTQIFQLNEIKSVEVVLMEVPCCGGIAQAAHAAREKAGAKFPLKISTVGVQGNELGSLDV